MTHRLATTALFGLALALGALALPSEARADYAMPTLQSGFGQSISTIVDATIDRYDDKGVAHITVHEVIRGNQTPKTLFDVRYTCFGGTLKNYGVKAGQRYIFLLHDDAVFEERSYFAVTADKARRLSVEFGESYRDWLGLPKATMSRSDAIDALKKVSARHPYKPKP